jgi:murein DD-endopeptidase MepM/ murein hydrolase activator NlpD
VIANTAVTNGPAEVLQHFGVNPAAYARFGLAGHDGVDLATVEGQQLYAPIDGTIKGPFYDPGGWGLNLTVESWEGEQWYLCHLSSIGSSIEGDEVTALTPIALAGSTGNTSGGHVHVVCLPWRFYNEGPYRGRVDPLPFLLRTR